LQAFFHARQAMILKFAIGLWRRQPLIELIPFSFWIIPVFQQHKARHAIGELEHILNLKASLQLSGYSVYSLIAKFGGNPASLSFKEIHKSRTEFFVLFSRERRIGVESRKQPKESLLAQIRNFHSEIRGSGNDKTLKCYNNDYLRQASSGEKGHCGDQVDILST
jgi:hypothetical protein